MSLFTIRKSYGYMEQRSEVEKVMYIYLYIRIFLGMPQEAGHAPCFPTINCLSSSLLFGVFILSANLLPAVCCLMANFSFKLAKRLF